MALGRKLVAHPQKNLWAQEKNLRRSERNTWSEAQSGVKGKSVTLYTVIELGVMSTSPPLLSKKLCVKAPATPLSEAVLATDQPASLSLLMGIFRV